MNVSSTVGWQDDLLDRELVLTRVVDAPRDLLFSVWSDPDHLPKWFGPEGFIIHTHEIDIAVGGCWRFDMIAPDGTRYDNRMVFTRIEPPTLIEAEHGSDKDDDPGRFMLRVTFLEQPDGRTVVTLRQLHPSAEQRDAVLGLNAVELGYQTLDKMSAYGASLKAG